MRRRASIAVLILAVASATGADERDSSFLEPSPVIAGLTWAPPDTIIRLAEGSDNWPTTWGDDELLYTAYGDGWGFEPKVPEKLSLGLARIADGPDDPRGTNLRSPSAEQVGQGAQGKKASGMLMVDGVLYMLVRNADNSQLAWSNDRGATWTWADWRFETSFGCPTFLNFGKNYAGARDEYVYIYSHDSDSAYEAADGVVLARAPKDRLTDQTTYAFFEGLDSQSKPRWSDDVSQRTAIYQHPDSCYRVQISYCSPLQRYLMVHPKGGNAPVGQADRVDTRFNGGFIVLDAPEPWGPWTLVYTTDQWDVGPGETASFPTKWMSADGRTLHLVFSGDDCFSVRRATVQLRSDSPAVVK